MKTYDVTFVETIAYGITVEAENDQEAVQKAREWYQEGEPIQEPNVWYLHLELLQRDQQDPSFRFYNIHGDEISQHAIELYHRHAVGEP